MILPTDYSYNSSCLNQRSIMILIIIIKIIIMIIIMIVIKCRTNYNLMLFLTDTSVAIPQEKRARVCEVPVRGCGCSWGLSTSVRRIGDPPDVLEGLEVVSREPW